MFSIHGTKQNIQLDRIHDNHGLYTTFDMNNNFQYIITLPTVTSIMIAQGGSTVELEYETIQSAGIASEVSQAYGMGRSLSCEHETLMKIVEWNKSVMLINENVNLSRKSMKAIVLMFTKKTGRTDSEDYCICTPISRKSMSLSKAILIWFRARE